MHYIKIYKNILWSSPNKGKVLTNYNAVYLSLPTKVNVFHAQDDVGVTNKSSVSCFHPQGSLLFCCRLSEYLSCVRYTLLLIMYDLV